LLCEVIAAYKLMAQYQSFPDAPGDSLTLEKLKALRLPPMQRKRFLDVGCNEGFFCGYALWDGATRSVGIDQNARFIARARQRFRGCEFLQRSWDRLPEGPFDVILLASALHYADDQPALVNALVSRLAVDGTLVLELGIHSSKKNEWVLVKRGIDKRNFPSMSKLAEVLQNYAWKCMGPSVMQQGDPVRRFVVHVRHRRPVVYLLMQPPGYGKSSIGRALFNSAAVLVVSGDEIIHQVARARLDADAALKSLIDQDYSPLRIDLVTQRIFEAGLVRPYIDLVAQHAGAADFALDAYVPGPYHAAVAQGFAEKGYMPVQLTWERVGAPETSIRLADERAEAYFASLSNSNLDVRTRAATKPIPFKDTKVFVDEITLEDDQLTVRGWALNETGTAPSILVVDIAGMRYVFDRYEKHHRPDVQKHFSLAHAICGYALSVHVESAVAHEDLDGKISLFAGESLEALSGPFKGPGVRKT
jgi:SAM-dependent methyltransferase